MLFYPAIRSTIERFRGDVIRGTDHFGLLSTSQIVSIGVAVVALWIWKTRSPLGLAPEQELEKEDDLDLDSDLFDASDL
jgi:prolipoprotein diacylglyceryltransferase